VSRSRIVFLKEAGIDFDPAKTATAGLRVVAA
jgi:hypothetical protein